MRLRTAAALIALAAAAVAACSHRLAFIAPDYEYEEDLTLSLDGSATLVVNASVPALIALRGVALDTALGSRADLLKAKIHDVYDSPYSHVMRVSSWIRYGRRFVGVRLRVPDIRALPKIAPFSWSAYELRTDVGQVVYRQTLST